MKPVTADEFFIKQALRLAERGRGHTSPNPMVGAVVVRGDVVVGKGYHQRVGGPHAEVNALHDAGDQARNATLYVTLEPCNHHGRTPPCTQAITRSGIARVVVGMSDPNRNVEGGGAAYLRAQGLQVVTGVLEGRCRALNQAFIKHVTTGLPLVVIKAAASLDGRIATRSGDSKWISNERSRKFVHQLRCDVDGIVVGVGTALADDPQLTSRISRKACRQPIRIVLDSHLRLPLDSQLMRTAHEVPVWVACLEGASGEKAAQLKNAGADLILCPPAGNHIDLQELLRELGNRQLTSVLVEGGAQVLGAFMEARLADEFYLFYAPKILGDPDAIPMVRGCKRLTMAEALPAYGIRVRRFGEDVLLYGRFREQIY